MTSDTQTEVELVVSATDSIDISSSQPETEDILDTVDDLIVRLHEAKMMPLSSNALVDREIFLTKLEGLRASLPDELRAARWMVREREAFISRTNEKAREIVDSVRRGGCSAGSISSPKRSGGNILVRRAEGDARRLRLEGEDASTASFRRSSTCWSSSPPRCRGRVPSFTRRAPGPPRCRSEMSERRLCRWPEHQ
jgi:hypothetical protein